MEAKRKVQKEQADKVRAGWAMFQNWARRAQVRPDHTEDLAAALCPTLFLPLLPMQLAREHGIRFFETSAKSSMNVDEVRHAPSFTPQRAPEDRLMLPFNLSSPISPFLIRLSVPSHGTSYSSQEAGDW